MPSFKNILLAGIAALVFSSQSVTAQSYSPYSYYNNWSNSNYGSNYRNPYRNYGSGYNTYRRPNTGYNSYNQRYPAYGYGNRGTSPYNPNQRYNAYRPPSAGAGQQRAPAPAQNRPATPGSSNPSAMANRYRAPQPYNYRPAPGYRQPYAYGYGQRPWYKKKKDDGIFGDGPFSGGDFAEEMWPGRDSVWEDALPLDGPWNRDWGKAPWNRDYADMYGDEGGPTKWFDWEDPKEGVAVMWEDALYSPHAVGTMPGGWDAPTVVVPNPVDVGDEFKDASADFPGEIRDFADGFTYGDRTVTGNKAGKNPNAGGFGVGNKKKKDGINIESKPRR